MNILITKKGLLYVYTNVQNKQNRIKKCNEMRNKQIPVCRENSSITERGKHIYSKIYMPLPLSFLCTDNAIKSGGVKLALWNKSEYI